MPLRHINDRTTALGIGARRRKEPCAVERSTEARA